MGERCCWVCCTAVSTASDLRPSLELLSQPSPVDHVETAPDERKCTVIVFQLTLPTASCLRSVR